MDWYKVKTGNSYVDSNEDPGVLSVRKIYTYFKQHGYATIVMGASFRNTGEILALAGCDRLTIAPNLLDQLSESTEHVECVLSVEKSEAEARVPKIPVDEASFRYALNDDAMATEKLAEGIRGFAADIMKLEKIVTDRLNN